MMFNKEGFIHHMKEEFPDMDSHFIYDMVENIVCYACKYHNTMESCIECIVEFVPQVTREEVERFWN